MQKIEWNDSLSVGVRKLDEQHKELIRIINALIARDPAEHREELTNALDRMTRYAEYHFRSEEEFMLGHGFPDYASHKREHTEFKARTAHFCVEAMANKATLPEELLLYLTDWLQNHILKSDMKYKDFLVQRGLAELPTKA
jgi:hemerythrin